MDKDNALVEKVNRLEKDVDKINDKIDRFDIWKQEQDLNNLKSTQDLKELIIFAVSEGQKTVLSEIEKINLKIEILEDKEKNKALEFQKKFEEEKKENRKWLFRTIIACVVTFIISLFLTTLANNFMGVNSFEKQLKNYENGIEKKEVSK